MNKIINIILVLVFLANPVLGQFAMFGSRTNQEKFDRGVTSFNDGRYASAAGIFRKLVQSEPDELVTASAMMLMKSEYHAGNIANAKLVGGDFINRYPQSSYLKDVYLCFGDMFVNSITVVEESEMLEGFEKLTDYVFEQTNGFEIDGWVVRTPLEFE